MKRGFVFSIHSIAGLVSGLFILLMSLSGAVLVFHDELDSLQYPSIIAEDNKQIATIDSCYNSLQRNYPHAQISNCHIAESITHPFRFTIYDPSYKEGTEALQVFMHPQTATILKTRSGKNNFISWVGSFHSSFHLKKKGEWLLGFFALVFLLSITTGVIMYRRNIWAVLAFKKKVFKKANLHQLIGVYALLFNLMIAITGFWMQRYVFKKDFYKSYDYTPVLKAAPPLFFSLDNSFRNIKEKFPGFTGYVIYFAQSKKGKTAIYGSQNTNSFIHSKEFADAIFLDSTGNFATTAFVNEIDASSRYDIINSQVHFGQYGGLPVKIIYFLFGLTGGVLSITGFLLWVKRKKTKNTVSI
jgi:uncharacterized iron-regulated membrane protein